MVILHRMAHHQILPVLCPACFHHIDIHLEYYIVSPATEECSSSSNLCFMTLPCLPILCIWKWRTDNPHSPHPYKLFIIPWRHRTFPSISLFNTVKTGYLLYIVSPKFCYTRMTHITRQQRNFSTNFPTNHTIRKHYGMAGFDHHHSKTIGQMRNQYKIPRASPYKVLHYSQLAHPPGVYCMYLHYCAFTCLSDGERTKITVS